ncbi:MAG: hypothetical protein KC877_01915 [Candidatus Kaiserbacteria bacterium]|nr:hypothetical protein [Candidatus Kaiserbacteria bacterium]MCB9815893.1 hypothetical protein [Candidatus Nomurabacteria bacterium]
MKKQDALSIIITFVMGFAAGVYLFLSQAAPVVHKYDVPTEEKVSQFMIVGDVYGVCRNTCPSFQVQADGTYRYLYTPRAGAEQILREGELPAELKRKLRSALTVSALNMQSREIEPAICNSYTDGIDILYDITLDGTQYYLDSCGTDVDPDGAVWSTLSDVWDYFERGA